MLLRISMRRRTVSPRTKTQFPCLQAHKPNKRSNGRALKQVIEEGLLVKIGQGLYAKSRPSTINPSKRVLAASGGFKEVSREALTRLGIPWVPSEAEESYNRGTSTQIPANAPVVVQTRTSRKICFDNFCLNYKVRTSAQKYPQNSLRPRENQRQPLSKKHKSSAFNRT
jgi:hypothetical protein